MNANQLVNLITAIPFTGNTAVQNARTSFIQAFPEARIATLTATQYNGGKSSNSFCYNLEYNHNLPFGIGGRNARKFGKNNQTSNLVQGISAMIADAKRGNISGLQSRHGLSSIDQDILIKILSIYIPDKFLTVGQEYTLALLGKILNVSASTNDRIELNYKCNEELLRLNPGFSSYEYNRLGAAVWQILSPENRNAFDKWLQLPTNLANGSGARYAYVSCIEFLSLYYGENFYSSSVPLSDLNTLYNNAIANQQLKGGTFYYSKPSYGKKYYYSSAVQKYIDFLKAKKGTSSTSPTPASPVTVSSPSPLPQEPYYKNIILYGPPGTGKTYNSIRYAIAISEWIDVSVLHNSNQYVDRKGNPKDVKVEFQNLLNTGRIVFTTFHQSLSYEDFIEGIKPKYLQKSKTLTYPTESGIFKKICNAAESAPSERFVLIIDEINRGNVAQIFGELITLIEEDKREGAENELKCTLPYSGERFCVPDNLYIIGTMNTADRSVEALDTALRRRFKFIEMMPICKLVPSVARSQEVFTAINQRISILKDTEHQIGHSYFKDVATELDLCKVFRQNIIPLLQEYFFGDMERIRMVLGKDFVKEEPIVQTSLFPNYNGDIDIPTSMLRLWTAEEWDNCEKDIASSTTSGTTSEFSKAIDSLLNG